jgi:hypothetical protein
MQKKYILVEKQTRVLLGPSFWRHRFFQSELDDLEIDYTLSPTDPDGYLRINGELELFPIELSSAPELDPIYEQFVGPFYYYKENVAHEVYQKKDLDINSVKQNLKLIAKNERIRKQNLNISTTVANTEIQIATDIDTQNKYIALANSVGTDTINYKSSAGFLTLTGSDFQIIVDTIHNYTQEQFNWEKSICDMIDSAETVDELKKIVIIKRIDRMSI